MDGPGDPTQPDGGRGPLIVAGVIGVAVVGLLLGADPATPGAGPMVQAPAGDAPELDAPERDAPETTPVDEVVPKFVPPAGPGPGIGPTEPPDESLAGRVVSAEDPPYRVTQSFTLEIGPYRRPEVPEQRVNSARLRKAELLAARQLLVLTETRRRFRELFADPLDLPDLEDEGVALHLQCLWDEAAQRDWLAEHGSGPGELDPRFYDSRRIWFTPSPDVAGALSTRQYDPRSGWIVSHVGRDTLQLQDEHRCARGRIQKSFDQDTARLGVEQLLDVHARGAPGTERGEALSPWLVQGLASLIGGFEYDEAARESLEGTQWHHGRLVLDLVRAGRRYRRDHGRWWTLRELVDAPDDAEVESFARMNSGWRPSSIMVGAFRVQAWLFVHFCRHYDGGKYRAALLESLRLDLKGERGADALAQAFGLNGPGDWAALEGEYGWYRTQCLNRRSGPKVDPRTHVQVGVWRADTAPPVGPCVVPDDREYDDPAFDED